MWTSVRPVRWSTQGSETYILEAREKNICQDQEQVHGSKQTNDVF